MSLGMSYTDYWEGENCLPSFFIQAYNKRRKREMEEQNFSAWLMLIDKETRGREIKWKKPK